MDTPTTAPDTQMPGSGQRLTFDQAAGIVWESAWEALVLTFLVLLFGTIALGMVGGLWQQMTPSLPPGLAGPLLAEAPARPVGAGALTGFFHHHRFWILFAALFAVQTCARLARASQHQERRRAGVWVQRVCRGISEHWFGLIVANAFIAMVGVLILRFTEFSWIKFGWSMLRPLFGPPIQKFLELFPSGPVRVLNDLWSWFQANQFKFSFWLLYSAAICDDLGLPNYKTLTHSLWRRYSQRKTAGRAVAGSQGSRSGVTSLKQG